MSNFIKEWTQKEIESLTRSFRRHSIFIFILKFVLPLTALGLAALLFIYPALSGKAKKLVLVAQEVKNIKPGEDPAMINPKFLGVDSKNQPYQINAKQAVQEKTGILVLEDVTADMTLEDGKWLSVVAHNGRYDAKNQWISLDDDVNIFMIDEKSNTYQVTAKDTYIDLAASTMKSDNPVRLQSTLMNFTAQNFILDNKKEKITFKGPVKLIILKP